MTEDEARQTLCCGPKFSAVLELGAKMPANSAAHANAAASLLCAGRKCMAWRWSEPYLLTKDGRAHNVDWKANEPVEKVEPGYCGLAGKP